MRQRVAVRALAKPNLVQQFGFMAITLMLSALLAACGTGTADQPLGEGTALPGPGDLQVTLITGDTGTNGAALTLRDIADHPEQ